MYHISTAHKFQCTQITEIQNQVEQIKSLRLHLYFQVLGPFSDASRDLVIATNRLISKMICPVGQRFPEVVVHREDYWYVFIAVAFAISWQSTD